MLEWLRLAFPFAALFTVSLAASYLATQALMRRRTPKAPENNAKLRLRAASGVYRSRYLGETECGWKFAAPIQRDAYVPLRVGEDLVVEAVAESGVMIFRTTIIDRSASDHTFVVKRPVEAYVRDRRAEVRRTDVGGHVAQVEGRESQMLNVSRNGACLVTDALVKPGDRIRVQLPWRAEPIDAHTLELDGRSRFRRIRVRFDEMIAMPATMVA